MKAVKMPGQEIEMAGDRREHIQIDAKVLSNLFLEWSEVEKIPLSPMKLQKLLYFCHADYLAEFRIPILKQAFEAWEFGPVVPSVYQEFKKFGNQPITVRAYSFNPLTAEKSISIAVIPHSVLDQLRLSYDKYKGFGAIALSHLSHIPFGPWRQARSMFANGLNADRRISDEMILRFHAFSDE